MNKLYYQTLDETTAAINIPADLSEISFDQLLAIQDSTLTDIEVLSILTGVSKDELYNAADYDTLIGNARLYIELFNHKAKDADLRVLPKRVDVLRNGKTVTIKISKHLEINPAGSYLKAQNAISKHVNSLKESETQSKELPLLACVPVVDAFMSYPVLKKNKEWKGFEDKETFTGNMKALDVLSIANYFYHVYPNLNVAAKKEGRLAKLFNNIRANIN